MSTISRTGEARRRAAPVERNGVPLLQAGDRLSVEEFERRYEAMPDLKKAELIEGVVYMTSAVRIKDHGAQHSDLMAWLGYYRAFTAGVEAGDNSSLTLLVGANRPQPDGLLRIIPDAGQTTTTPKGYVRGGPEFIGEVTASTASYDLHDKLHAYERNHVLEYLVWRVQDRAIDWFIPRGGKYRRLTLSKDGAYRSKVFPGLWLDVQAMIDGNLRRVLEVVQRGIASPEHDAFVARLERGKRRTGK
jgi:Uma2 family endonuclease